MGAYEHNLSKFHLHSFKIVETIAVTRECMYFTLAHAQSVPIMLEFIHEISVDPIPKSHPNLSEIQSHS